MTRLTNICLTFDSATLSLSLRRHIRRITTLRLIVLLFTAFLPYNTVRATDLIPVPVAPITPICLARIAPFSLAPASLIQTGEQYTKVIASYIDGRGSERPLDLDQNGILDLVAIKAGSSAITVLLNISDTTFAKQLTYSVGAGPKHILAGDLDRDGLVDLVIANSFDITVLRNTGKGSFAPWSSLSAGFQTGVVGPAALGDFDGDGDLDIAAVDGPAPSYDYADGMVTFVNNGLGSFSPGPGFLIILISPTSLQAFHANADGKIDLVMTNKYTSFFGLIYSESVNVLRNQTAPGGPISFTTGPEDAYQFNATSSGAAIADFNGDKRADIVALRDDTRSIVPLLSNGDSTFRVQPQVSYGASTPAATIIRADLDRNGTPDVVSSIEGSSSVSVLLNQGGANFGPAVNYAASPAPRWLTAADVDRDGDLDVITVNNSSGLSVLKNRRITIVCR